MMQTVLQKRARALVTTVLCILTYLTMLPHRMELDGAEAAEGLTFFLSRLKNFALALLNLLIPGCSFELID